MAPSSPMRKIPMMWNNMVKAASSLEIFVDTYTSAKKWRTKTTVTIVLENKAIVSFLKRAFANAAASNFEMDKG